MVSDPDSECVKTSQAWEISTDKEVLKVIVRNIEGVLINIYNSMQSTGSHET